MECERNVSLRNQAKQDYLLLVDEVNKFQGKFKKLCDKLSGFNEQPDYTSFDVNYGCLTATVYNENGHLYVYEFIDIWDDEKTELVFESISYSDLFE